MPDFREGDIHEQECGYRKEEYERPLVGFVSIGDGQYPGREEQYHQDERGIVIKGADQSQSWTGYSPDEPHQSDDQSGSDRDLE